MEPAGRKGNRQPHQPPYPSAAQVLAYAVAECSAPCSLRFRQIAPATSTMTMPMIPRTTSPPCPPLANCGAMPSDLKRPSRPTPTGPLKNACNPGCTAGSVAITSPAIQPSKPAPAHTSAGSRVSKAMISAAPATIRGTLMASPMTSSGMLPLAAAATDDVVEAHHDVGDRHDLHGRPQMRRRVHAALVLLFRHQQLCRDHEQRQSTD